jgi:hypothetical protein
MNVNKTKLDRAEQALWQVPPPAAPQTAVEVWQANLMRTLRLATTESAPLLDLSWLALQRAAVTAVIVATLGWCAAWIWSPVFDHDLAELAWTQSVGTTTLSLE